MTTYRGLQRITGFEQGLWYYPRDSTREDIPAMDAVTPAAAAPTLPPSTLVSVGTMLATKGLAMLAMFLVTHGLMSGSNTEAFIALAPLLVSLAWSGYVQYARPIFLAQLEVLKAKSLAQAAALKAANLPKVTVSQIAAQSPSMTQADVAKVVATLPAEIKANVAPVA